MLRRNSLVRAHRLSIRVLVAFVVLSLGARTAHAATITFEIEPQDLSGALKAFAIQSHREIFFAPELARGRKSQGVKGTYDDLRALNIILDGTGLEYSVTASDAILVRDPASKSAPHLATPAPTSANNDPTDPPSSTSPVLSGDGKPTLTEIVVTAQKKSERLQDVPVPVTAVDPDALAQVGQNRVQDFFETVPSLNVDAGDSGQQSLSIRGISTGGGTNPTVAVTIDDVPYGSSTILGLGNLLFPDIDPSDLARIEILRGPQGTLYGASSIGGLINFVTQDPSTTELSGRAQVLGSDVEHGEFGYGVRGAVNIALTDTIALRASAFTRRDPGYVDNVTTGGKDVNQVDVSGWRLSALWKPADNFSLKLSALQQTTTGDGTSAVDTNSTLQTPVYGDLQQTRLAGAENYSARAGFYTATLKARFADMSLVSITGYNTSDYSQITDATSSLGSLAQAGMAGSGFNGFGVSGASEGNRFNTYKFSQEVRLSSTGGHFFDWLVGAFYTHEASPADQDYIANNASTGTPVGVMINFAEPSSLQEYAGFGDLTVHFTDRFDVQFGGRESRNSQTYNEVDSGLLVPVYGEGPSPYVQPTEHTDGNAFTYLVTPQFKFSPDLMVYARFASGYRVGGLNVEAQLLGVPSAYAPDKTSNYELGIKGDFLDRRLTVDASAYYIDWRHIQIYLENPKNGAAYYQNGGTAKSEGLELTVRAKPTRGLTLAAVAAVDDADLTQNLPSTNDAVGFSGDRLPFSSRFSGSLSADQDIAISGRWTGFLGGTLSYVGDREGPFAVNFSEPRFRYPGYAKADFRVGVRDSAWTANFFVNNACNRRGIVGGGISFAQQPYSVFYIQPLTVGLSLMRLF